MQEADYSVPLERSAGMRPFQGLHKPRLCRGHGFCTNIAAAGPGKIEGKNLPDRQQKKRQNLKNFLCFTLFYLTVFRPFAAGRSIWQPMGLLSDTGTFGRRFKTITLQFFYHFSEKKQAFYFLNRFWNIDEKIRQE